MSGERERADKLLVARGFFESRASARAAIEAGRVSADDTPVFKSSQMLDVDCVIKARAAHPYVSRGGLKLAHGLKAFKVDPAGRSCLDLGASTGGFTDVLLQEGAAHVTCIDVGRDQLHRKLRNHPQVRVYESTDVRYLTSEHIKPDISLLVTDLSFISLEKALEAALSFASAGAEFIGLFKPQFQVGRKNIGRKGIVTDLVAADHAASQFEAWMTEKGWPILEWTASPVLGGDGNAERLFYAFKQ